MRSGLLVFCLLVYFLIPCRVQSTPHIQADSLIQRWNRVKDTASAVRKFELLSEIANAYHHDKPDSAVIYCDLALELARSAEDQSKEAYFSYQKGTAQYVIGKYDFALENFLTGLKLSREIGDKKGIARGLNSVGIIFNMNKQEREAISNHDQSIVFCRETGDTLLWTRNLHNIGLALDNLKKYDSALLYADSAVRMLSLRGNSFEKNRTIVFRGWIYHNMDDYQNAEAEFRKVINDPTYDDKWEISYALLGLASVYQKQGNIGQSIHYGLKSQTLAKEIGALWDLQEITRILAGSYERQKDFEAAYRYQVLFKQYSDSIFNDTKDKKINFLQLQHQRDENFRLEQENELILQRINRKNFQLIGYSVSVLLLIVLSVVLYQKIVQKNRLNRELAHLNATKDTLFHIIAHDIKSPMSIMISFTELLKEDFDDFEKAEILKILDRLNKSSNEGLQLLENLLHWAKSQTGKLVFTPEKLQVAALVTDTIKLMSLNAQSKHIGIEVKVPEEVNCFADRNMTSVILRNLVSNAIKFTPKNGGIIIEANVIKGEVCISISDNGVGIATEDLEKLFNIETSFSTIGTNHEKGSGLGLMLCKDFVTKQGGSIGVESEPGKGSRFFFTLQPA